MDTEEVQVPRGSLGPSARVHSRVGHDRRRRGYRRHRGYGRHSGHTAPTGALAAVAPGPGLRGRIADLARGCGGLRHQPQHVATDRRLDRRTAREPAPGRRAGRPRPGAAYPGRAGGRDGCGSPSHPRRINWERSKRRWPPRNRTSTIDGVNIANLDTCLAGVNQALNEISLGDQSGAGAILDRYAGNCQAAEPSG